MSKNENLRKVLKNTLFFGLLDHNGLVHRKSNLGFEKWTFINVQNEKAGKSFEKAISEK